MYKIPVQIIDVYSDTETPRKGVFPPVEPEDLGKEIRKVVRGDKLYFDNRHTFYFFKLAKEDPWQAGEYLRKAISWSGKLNKHRNKGLFKKAKKGKLALGCNSNLVYEKAWDMCNTKGGINLGMLENAINVLGMIRHGTANEQDTLLDSFEDAYEKLASKRDNPSLPEIKTICDAIKDRNFEDGGHYHLEETMKIPEDTMLMGDRRPTAAEAVLYMMSGYIKASNPVYFQQILWTEEKGNSMKAGFLMEGVHGIPEQKVRFLVETQGKDQYNMADNPVTKIYKTSIETPVDKFLDKIWGRNCQNGFKKETPKEAFGGKDRAGYEDTLNMEGWDTEEFTNYEDDGYMNPENLRNIAPAKTENKKDQ